MISAQEEADILERAYVPEHIISLMVGISQGEPFVRDGFLFLVKDQWLIFIGYPLGHDFEAGIFSAVLKGTLAEFKPASAWFIAPAVPETIFSGLRQRETDEYYQLDLQNFELKKDFRRFLLKASQALTIDRTQTISPEHTALTREFLEREELPPRIRELYLRLPDYVAHSRTSLVLSARDAQKNLSGYYVVELGAKRFATYVVGCYSREKYVPHASDLLFHEMILLAREKGKEYIHLGLGVNEGIRRFKRKWGGVPFLPYELGEWGAGRPLRWIEALQVKL